MGWITNISFPEGMEQNGTKIRPGMSTQVRWDIGIGDMRIGTDGKIMADAWHSHPLSGKQKEAYQKELANWTGYLDTNMGTLFLENGQVRHLDLSYEGVGEWVVNNIKTDWNDCDKGGLYHTLTPEQWVGTNTSLNLYRGLLLSTDKINEEEEGGYALTLARKAYVERSGELIDPFYKPKTPNGFIHA
jgi:hypothetical protein